MIWLVESNSDMLKRLVPELSQADIKAYVSFNFLEMAINKACDHFLRLLRLIRMAGVIAISGVDAAQFLSRQL